MDLLLRFWREFVTNAKYVPTLTENQILPLVDSCDGIVRGVRPGSLIHKFTDGSLFPDYNQTQKLSRVAFLVSQEL